MARSEIKLDVKFDSTKVEKQVEKCTNATKKLAKEIEKLNSMEININVNTTNKKSKWYQFWKL